MIKIILFLIFSVLDTFNCYSQVIREGNTYIQSSTIKTDTITSYTYRCKNGDEYPIYRSKNNCFYIIRISKKTGKEYKQYLPKDIQEDIKKDLGLD